MIFKEFSMSVDVATLKELASEYPEKKNIIDAEIVKIRAGQEAEREAARYISRVLGSSEDVIVINNIRLQYDKEVLQIDHLLIDRSLRMFVLETKSARYGLKVDKAGNFSRRYNNVFRNIPSPVAQARAQARLLEDYFNSTDLLPSKLGRKLKADIRPYVLISPETWFINEGAPEGDLVLRFDTAVDKIFAEVKTNSRTTLTSLLNVVSFEALQVFGNRICSHHRPHAINWHGKLRLGSPGSATVQAALSSPEPVSEVTPVDMAETTQPEHVCKNCGSADLVMKYGRSYYLACKSCNANTGVKMTAGSKIRKAGNLFYMVDASGSETIYFTNS